MPLPCSLSQVSRVDELLWALAADLEERWLVGGDQPSRLWALHQCAAVCKVRLGLGWVGSGCDRWAGWGARHVNAVLAGNA